MSEIEDLEVTVEEYLDGLAVGIDVLELKRLEAKGIPTNLALEVMAIAPKIINGTATPEEIVRGVMILTPSLREQIKSVDS
ncbi:hypothetical protein [Nostoc sp. UHCC 0252]|uniref:hypothetical protein n=1 Tax=Nostoc sp. UHCC 0252 TaxID=3110241 RepID=UPI002B200617|nr:hypothetical protein [Nostoc sp. UHCC 0252]MEA5602664.1 hypothetical protein [Nostoc sp. UHCC 0252]